MAAAYEGKTWGDLLDLTSDLPVDVRLGTDLETRPAAGATRGSARAAFAAEAGLCRWCRC